MDSRFSKPNSRILSTRGSSQQKLLLSRTLEISHRHLLFPSRKKAKKRMRMTKMKRTMKLMIRMTRGSVDVGGAGRARLLQLRSVRAEVLQKEMMAKRLVRRTCVANAVDHLASIHPWRLESRRYLRD
jgi:hypothetical protein